MCNVYIMFCSRILFSLRTLQLLYTAATSLLLLSLLFSFFGIFQSIIQRRRTYIYIYKSCEGDGSLERVPSAETANRVLIPTAAMLLVSANFSMPFFFRVVFLPREITSPRLHIYCWYNQGIVRCITGFVFIGKITE